MGNTSPETPASNLPLAQVRRGYRPKMIRSRESSAVIIRTSAIATSTVTAADAANTSGLGAFPPSTSTSSR